MREITTEELCENKKARIIVTPQAVLNNAYRGTYDCASRTRAALLPQVVIFATPAAFSPTCTMKHVPSFIEKSEALKAKGIDTIALVSVNDAFVLQAWERELGSQGKVVMLADGSAAFTKAIGVQLDLHDKGLGLRSRRYAMIVDNQIVKALKLEDGGAFTISSADEIINSL